MLLIVCTKKFLIPFLSRTRQQLANGSFQPCWCSHAENSGYTCCSCYKRASRSSQIDDCPNLISSSAPAIPVTKDCFLVPNDCWDFPSVESTFVPAFSIPSPLPTVTKSASDIRCLSPEIDQKYNERRPSCKSVRFAGESRASSIQYYI